MNIATQYQLLDVMGINLWLSRDNPDSYLVSDLPIFGAGCLVLLPEKLSNLAIEAQKILTGMLKVLELEADALCVAWLKDSSYLNQMPQLIAEISKWAPYSVLMMGEKLAQAFLPFPALNTSLHVTHHPDELILNKDLKRKAYQDLLDLKEQLKNARVS